MCTFLIIFDLTTFLVQFYMLGYTLLTSMYMNNYLVLCPGESCWFQKKTHIIHQNIGLCISEGHWRFEPEVWFQLRFATFVLQHDNHRPEMRRWPFMWTPSRNLTPFIWSAVYWWLPLVRTDFPTQPGDINYLRSDVMEISQIAIFQDM